MHELSDLQRDALMEIFNIGAGGASRVLSQLLGCEVALSVPLIIESTVADANRIIDPSLRNRDLCMVRRRVIGMDVELLMLFQGSREVVGSLIRNQIEGPVPAEQDQRESSAVRITNLISESCFNGIEDLLGSSLQRSACSFLPSIPSHLFGNAERGGADKLMIVKIDLLLKKWGVTSHLLIGFSEKDTLELADGLDDLLSQGA